MHSFIHNMFSANICVLIVIIGISLLANNVSCIKCYVCDVSNCSEINVLNKNQSNRFVKQCSTEYKGCVTQKSGNIVITRACEKYNGTTCRALNEIEYCFCAANLCNGPNYVPESDDEELEGGSGTEPTKDLDDGVCCGVVRTANDTKSGANVIRSITFLVCNFIWLI